MKHALLAAALVAAALPAAGAAHTAASAAHRAARAPGPVSHASRIGARPGGRARLAIGQPTADLLRARARTDRVTV